MRSVVIHVVRQLLAACCMTSVVYPPSVIIVVVGIVASVRIPLQAVKLNAFIKLIGMRFSINFLEPISMVLMLQLRFYTRAIVAVGFSHSFALLMQVNTHAYTHMYMYVYMCILATHLLWFNICSCRCNRCHIAVIFATVISVIYCCC